MATAKPKRRLTAKAATNIDRNLKELRQLIDTSDDPCERRIAQGMEYALRWALERTVGWQCMEREARTLAIILKQDLRRET